MSLVNIQTATTNGSIARELTNRALSSSTGKLNRIVEHSSKTPDKPMYTVNNNCVEFVSSSKGQTIKQTVKGPLRNIAYGVYMVSLKSGIKILME